MTHKYQNSNQPEPDYVSKKQSHTAGYRMEFPHVMFLYYNLMLSITSLLRPSAVLLLLVSFTVFMNIWKRLPEAAMSKNFIEWHWQARVSAMWSDIDSSVAINWRCCCSTIIIHFSCRQVEYSYQRFRHFCYQVRASWIETLCFIAWHIIAKNCFLSNLLRTKFQLRIELMSSHGQTEFFKHRSHRRRVKMMKYCE